YKYIYVCIQPGLPGNFNAGTICIVLQGNIIPGLAFSSYSLRHPLCCFHSVIPTGKKELFGYPVPAVAGLVNGFPCMDLKRPYSPAQFFQLYKRNPFGTLRFTAQCLAARSRTEEDKHITDYISHSAIDNWLANLTHPPTCKYKPPLDKGG